MPVYQYRDKVRNCLVELRRPVAERDMVPAGLERILIPERIAIHGTTSSPPDPDSCESQVKRGFRQLEDKMPASAIAREGGYTVEQIKNVWGI